MNKINDGAPYPVDGRVELKYRLLALTVFGVGLALGLSIVVFEERGSWGRVGI